MQIESPMPPANDPLHPRASDPPGTSWRFESIVANVEDYAVMLLSPEGTVESWNRGAQRLIGYSAAEIIGRDISIFHPPDALERRWPKLELDTATREGRVVDEGWRVRKSGDRFWANVTITALRSDAGDLCGFLKITRDLDDKTPAQDKLQRNEEWFRLFIEGVRDYAMFMLDPQGRVATWNPGAERIKGYAPSEILGQHFSRFYSAEAVAQRKPEWELQQALEHGHVEDEGWRVRKDGTRFWATWSLQPFITKPANCRGSQKLRAT